MFVLGRNRTYALAYRTSEVKGFANEDFWYSAHTQAHTQMDFSEAVFCEMRKILSYVNATSCCNVANSASSFFFLLYPHTLLLPTFIMPNGPFSAPAASKCFGFCFQSQLVASAIALLIPTQHLLWWKRGQCSLTAASGTKPFPRVCCGGFGGRASALLLGSRPTGLPSRADRQYLQNAVEERHYPQRYYGIDIL